MSEKPTLNQRRLIEARLAAGLNRMGLARRLNYGDVSTVRNWENGYYDPTVYNLKRLCKVLDVSADYLLGED